MATATLLLCSACAKEEHFVGTYQYMPPPGKRSPELPKFYVELKEGGKGVRWVDDKKVYFNWVVKNNEIRVHTKAGGVIVGKLQGDTLLAEFPGKVVFRFKKIK